jgi:hypothetical protein
MGKYITILVFILINCNFFDKADRGVSPFAKFLSLINLDRTATTVTSVLPKDKSTGNYLNTNIFIVLNKNVSGFTTSNFTLSPDGGATNHPGKVVISENVIGFYPSQNFLANATYKGTLKAENGLATEFTFTNGMGTLTDTTPPSITSTNPLTGDTNMPINITISATFNETIDPSTITASSFTISNGVTGTVSITDQTASFKPTSYLPSNTTLTATIKAGVKDLAGNTMSSTYSWTFTTGTTVATSCTNDVSFYDTCLFNN